MLLCNNTAIQPIRLINPAQALLPAASPPAIIGAMSETDDLARRFLALWAEYLTATLAEPKTAESLRHWLEAAAGAPPIDGSGDASPRSARGAAPTAVASGERDPVVAQLAGRIDELAERVASLEGRRRPAGGARRRHRPARS
jgi:hypothetical protein